MSSEFGIPSAPVKEQGSPRRLWHFGLRSLFVVVAIVAAIIGCVVATPVFAFLACLIYVGTSCVVLATLFYGTGWIKGFAIGFTVPHAVGYLIAINTFGRPENVLILFLIANAMSVFTGLTTAIALKYLKSVDGKIAVPQLPFLRDWLSND